jgi:hypothetical protein
MLNYAEELEKPDKLFFVRLFAIRRIQLGKEENPIDEEI